MSTLSEKPLSEYEKHTGESALGIGAYDSMVAFCDILGFKRLISDVGTTRLANEVQQGLGRCIHNALYRLEETKPLHDFSELQKEPEVGVVLFSDSLLVYGRDGSEKAINRVIETVAWLLFRSLFWTRFRFRVGLAYGGLCAAPKSSVFLGPAIVRAYELEEQQEWMGAAVDAWTSDFLSKTIYRDEFTSPSWDPPLVRYPVPLKEGRVHEGLAINWTFITPPGPGIVRPSDDDLRTLDTRTRESVLRKYENTQEFFKRVSRYYQP